MNKNLITILVVIAVLVGLYYLISPYQNCYRNILAGSNATAGDKVYAMQECSYTKSW
jgi:hypothetical protein